MRYILLILLLSGCSTLPKQVNIPVQVKCVSEKPAKPDYIFTDSKDKSIAEQVRALLIDRETSKGYEASLEATLAGCE